jgi:hypothetical protein
MQFRSLAAGLYGNQELHIAVREVVVSHIMCVALLKRGAVLNAQ